MEENRNANRNEEQRHDDDQLRPSTTNEAIREISGNPEADLSRIGTSASNDNTGSSRTGSDEGLQGSDRSQGVSYSPNDMSATKSGGLTDMDDQTASGGTGLNAGERLGGGSNLTTRRTVTGSDFDGQDKTS